LKLTEEIQKYSTEMKDPQTWEEVLLNLEKNKLEEMGEQLV